MSPLNPAILHRLRLPLPKAHLNLNLSLYLVANRPSFQDETLFFERIKHAVKGGVSCVQLRDYENNVETTIKTAVRLKEILKEVPLFINTLHSFDVARSVDAAGVYIENGRFSMRTAHLCDKKWIVGVPVRTMNDVLTLENVDKIDYLSVKIWPSKTTCPRNDQLWGIDGLRNVRAISTHRIVAIGGIDLSSVDAVYRELYFHDGVAMAGGLMNEQHPEITARKIHTIHKSIKEKSC